jgi:hypothetical protein
VPTNHLIAPDCEVRGRVVTRNKRLALWLSPQLNNIRQPRDKVSF